MTVSIPWQQAVESVCAGSVGEPWRQDVMNARRKSPERARTVEYLVNFMKFKQFSVYLSVKHNRRRIVTLDFPNYFFRLRAPLKTLNLDSRVRGNDTNVSFYALRAMLPSVVIPAKAGIHVIRGLIKKAPIKEPLGSSLRKVR